MSWSAPIRSIIFLLILSFAVFYPGSVARAAIVNHIVISEIQVAGDVAADEFVELYNPTNQAVDLTGWNLSKRNSSGTSANIVTSMSGSIPAYGFYLVAHDSYNGTTPRDAGYSTTTSITDNSSIFLRDSGTNLIDLVGLGASTDAELFGTLDPIAGESVERKALPNSTNITMDVNGAHALLGNGEDTNNNGSDFTSRNIPQPQNSSSPIENPSAGAPTPTQTPVITPTTAPSPTTVIPSPTATTTPQPSVSPTNAPTPTVTPSPTPSPETEVVMDNQFMTCTKSYRTIKILSLTFRMPRFMCLNK